MEFSLWPSNAHTWDETLELARFAEAAGWRGFWFADHIMSQTPDDSPGEGDAQECWSILAAVAAAVPRIRLTSMVTPVTVHHPVVVAKRAATVDQISGGRVTLGLGAGWQVNEHRHYGFDLPAPKERVDRFAEAIELIASLLDGGRTTFGGQYFQVDDAPFAPTPVQSPLPLLVGTGSPRMLRLTARWADEWNTWGDPAQVGERTTAFLEACEREGRDPATVHRSVQAMIFLVDDPDRAAKLRERAPEGRSLVGAPAEIIDEIGKYVELGVDEFAIPDFTLGGSQAERMDILARLDAEVVSAFR